MYNRQESSGSQHGHWRACGEGLGSCPKGWSFIEKLFISHHRQGQSVGGDSKRLNALLFPSVKADLLM